MDGILSGWKEVHVSSLFLTAPSEYFFVRGAVREKNVILFHLVHQIIVFVEIVDEEENAFTAMLDFFPFLLLSSTSRARRRRKEGKVNGLWPKRRLNHDSRHWRVDRVLANHSLVSTASQGTSNIPFPWFLLSQCNRQARNQERSTIMCLAEEHFSFHLPDHIFLEIHPVGLGD